MKSIVVVSSLTGNTLKLASAVAYALNNNVEAVKVEEKPDVTYSDVGGCKEQIEKLREVVETPLLHVSG